MFKTGTQYVWSKTRRPLFLRHAQPHFVYYILQYEWINVIVLFLISFFVARLRFSLVYLCVQFVSSAAALHFLVKWISSFIAPSSQGVYIPCLNSFFVRTTPNPDHSANEDLFFHNVHGILSLCLKIIAVVNEGEKVTTRHTSWQLLAHLFLRSLFLSSEERCATHCMLTFWLGCMTALRGEFPSIHRLVQAFIYALLWLPRSS